MEDNKFKTHYEFKEDVIIQIPNDQYSKGIENGHNTIWKSTTFTGSIIALVSTLILSTWLEIIILKYYLPSLNSSDQAAIHFPHSLEDIYELNRIFSFYIEENFYYIYTAFFFTYIYLQSLSLPGSMWLSILGGALFPFWLTLFTVALCSAIGSSFAYLISSSVASVLVVRRLGDRIQQWKKMISEHKNDIFNYLIVLKLAPLPPNWLINISAPHLHVPLNSFFLATFIGVIPPSFIHVQAGSALDKIASSEEGLDLFSVTNVLCLIGVAVAALAPVYIRRRYQL